MMRKTPLVADGSTLAEHANRSWFEQLAIWTSRLSGRPGTFLIGVALVIIWAITGPIFDYSENWQLVINTGTTIVTFLMVFLIQATQNRDTLALHLKLNELIVATKDARDHFAGIENATERELAHHKSKFEAQIKNGAKRRRRTQDDKKAEPPRT
jgi:low affinity Fe/Cu permease